MSSTWDDWNAHLYQFYGKAEPMVDQVKCPECRQVVYVERGGRSVVTCLGCNAIWFVRYEGKTPLLRRFGTNRGTQKPATEKKDVEPSES